MRRWLWIAQLLALFLLTYAYLYPGSQALLSGRTDVVMSDDTDASTLPWAYGTVLRAWHEHPSYLLYGSVYTEGAEPDHPIPYWAAWSERWAVVLCSYIVPVEQISTAFVALLMVLNAMAMYALARHLRWGRGLSSGLALAWAFCAFTRARAKVHATMVGTYHLPLIFLALLLAVRGRGKRSLVASALCLLAAVTTAHYFVVTSLFLTPFFLAFYFLQPEFRQAKVRASLRLLVAVLPALLFLGWNYLKPVPTNATISRTDAYPKSGVSPTGGTHPFLYVFAAHPIDYLAGDIALEFPGTDWNPLRHLINDHILANLGYGNPHERTNGIRWLVIALALASLLAVARGGLRERPGARGDVIFFALFALFAFWLSLDPDTPFPHWGPSGWLQALISQVRVPSRAGIQVHFALLMMSGFLIDSTIRLRRIAEYPLLFPALMLVSYPPLVQNVPMAPVRPTFVGLPAENCGEGFYFPFINAVSAVDLYHIMQRFHRTDCAVLNNMQNPSRLALMARAFPPDLHYLNQLPTDAVSGARLEHLARCVPLHWIVFDPATPRDWRENECRKLGWQLSADLACVAPTPAIPLQNYPESCLK